MELRPYKIHETDFWAETTPEEVKMFASALRELGYHVEYEPDIDKLEYGTECDVPQHVWMEKLREIFKDSMSMIPYSPQIQPCENRDRPDHSTGRDAYSMKRGVNLTDKKLLINTQGRIQLANTKAKVGITGGKNIVFLCTGIPEGTTDEELLQHLNGTDLYFADADYSLPVIWDKCGVGRVYHVGRG